LCCGYPQKGSGQFDKAEKIITDNRVLFHRVANTLNYLDIKTVVVSCGTCYDQLQGYQFDKIFPGCRIIDIHEFLLEKGIKLESQGAYLFHDPCHSPMKLQEPMKTVKAGESFVIPREVPHDCRPQPGSVPVHLAVTLVIDTGTPPRSPVTDVLIPKK